jgi:hypothetical protein
MPTPVGRVDGMRASARSLLQVYRGMAQWLPELNGNRNPGRKGGGIAGLKVADARNLFTTPAVKLHNRARFGYQLAPIKAY